MEALNILTAKYNVAFNLSEFHIAIDLFSGSDNYYLHNIAGCVKSGRNYDPEERYKGTHYFHSKKSDFRLVTYDKRNQLLQKKKHTLSQKSLAELRNCNIVRIESRFNNTRLNVVDSLQSLATTCFSSFIFPERIKFLRPNQGKLAKHGIGEKHYRGLGLKQIRKILNRNHIKTNFFYYMEEHPCLTNLVKDAVEEYR